LEKASKTVRQIHSENGKLRFHEALSKEIALFLEHERTIQRLFSRVEDHNEQRGGKSEAIDIEDGWIGALLLSDHAMKNHFFGMIRNALALNSGFQATSVLFILWHLGLCRYCERHGGGLVRK
jgi:hypothetical protein